MFLLTTVKTVQRIVKSVSYVYSSAERRKIEVLKVCLQMKGINCISVLEHFDSHAFKLNIKVSDP